MNASIYEYVKEEEASFETGEVQVGTNWNWNFRNHVQMIFHLKNGMFFSGNNDWTTQMRAFKNIMEPILNLSYWSEDIEVKDVVFYIENEIGRVLSFLIKKYHDEVYVKEHDLDTLFDEITESDVDYGGVLVQKTSDGRPEVFELNTVAFADQTDIMGGPLAFKHFFAPDKLRKMTSFGWGQESNGATVTIEELITLAEPEKTTAGSINAQKNKIPGKSIEVYIIRGNLPEAYLEDNDNMEDWYNQVQIIAYYYSRSKKREGVTLYRKKEAEGGFKFHTSKKVYGRALGRGVGESLLHPQIWTNFLTIHKTNMLEAASKVPLYTDDEGYVNRNKIQEMENLEVTTVAQGRRMFQVPTASPVNVQLYETSINEWFEQAKSVGSSYDPLMGKEGASGTTFRGQTQLIQQGRGMHDRRRGQRAKFIEEIYRDWIIPDIVKNILKGKKFLANLSSEEMQWVYERIVDNAVHQMVLERLYNLVPTTEEERQQMKEKAIAELQKKGSKHLVEILKGEFEDIEVRMGINIANKQKDLAGMSDKLLSIIQFVIANPEGFKQTMQLPGMAKTFQDILEYSGLNQADFSALANMPPTPPQAQQVQPQEQAPMLQLQ